MADSIVLNPKSAWGTISWRERIRDYQPDEQEDKYFPSRNNLNAGILNSKAISQGVAS